MKNIKSINEFLGKSYESLSSSKTFVIGWFESYFNQNKGQEVNVKELNNKYLKLFIEEVQKLGYGVVKQYQLGGVQYVEFDKPYGQDVIDLYHNIEKRLQKSRVTGIFENILPKSYPKVKCLECGESVCDNLNYKIGHLYNKHNCKPSVGDYKAKKMLIQYFPI